MKIGIRNSKDLDLMFMYFVLRLSFRLAGRREAWAEERRKEVWRFLKGEEE